MKLNYVIIYVDDPVKSTRFYKKLFDIKIRFIHESNTYAEMDTGDTILAFAQNAMLQNNTGYMANVGTKNCFEIAFSTEKVQECFDKAVKNKAKIIKPPSQKPWGKKLLTLKTPMERL